MWRTLLESPQTLSMTTTLKVAAEGLWFTTRKRQQHDAGGDDATDRRHRRLLHVEKRQVCPSSANPIQVGLSSVVGRIGNIVYNLLFIEIRRPSRG